MQLFNIRRMINKHKDNTPVPVLPAPITNSKPAVATMSTTGKEAVVAHNDWF